MNDRYAFAKAACEACGLKANRTTALTFVFNTDGSVTATAKIYVDGDDLAPMVKRFKLTAVELPDP